MVDGKSFSNAPRDERAQQVAGWPMEINNNDNLGLSEQSLRFDLHKSGCLACKQRCPIKLRVEHKEETRGQWFKVKRLFQIDPSKLVSLVAAAISSCSSPWSFVADSKVQSANKSAHSTRPKTKLGFLPSADQIQSEGANESCHFHHNRVCLLVCVCAESRGNCKFLAR